MAIGQVYSVPNTVQTLERHGHGSGRTWTLSVISKMLTCQYHIPYRVVSSYKSKGDDGLRTAFQVQDNFGK